ncbi:potassium/proton antiporter [Deinococcus maricopensis]|uniref:Sodium/hydrogen exchanger n=1 Tax=Deinococcus maricopensis (strain DSM 21211 / LMG 22137 / NRRL B-23946 / LB-34) TaxID=709986 RepID=E8U539_DEIML|nr:potassium/proton antiporter [Deinococcus maricopensis]ADV66178.1 sodium/hydrogen exchanger [Deinococcus maricopensis DSM 21211]
MHDDAHVEGLFLAAGLLLLLSITLSKAGGRVGIPGLLLFLGVGMLAGSEGPGGIAFNDYGLAQAVGTVALCFILFQGGLDTPWVQVKPVLRRGLSLATIAVLGTAALMATFAHYVFGMPWIMSALLGAVVSSTDASAVFSVLKERRLGLKGDITPLLEFESGGNDPMAVFLTLGLVTLALHPEAGALSILPLFLKQMLIGGLAGLVLGRAGLWIINRAQLQFEGLYPVLTIAVALTVFSATAVAGGSGFLAVYIAGLILGNAEFIHKRSLVQFHDGLSWLMQITMFLTLGLLVFPSQLLPTAGMALACSFFLMFFARPFSVHLALLRARMPFREKAMVAWVGLRGAVPIVLATFPLLAGVPGAGVLFNIVFFIVLTSVLVQGTTLTLVARLFGVREALHERTPFFSEYTPTGHNRNEMVEVEVRPGSAADGERIMDLHLPPEALVILVHRGGEYLIPKGVTALQGGDAALVLAAGEELRVVREKFGHAH